MNHHRQRKGSAVIVFLLLCALNVVAGYLLLETRVAADRSAAATAARSIQTRHMKSKPLTLLQAANKNKNDKQDKLPALQTFRKSPGFPLILPFLVLFGVDLILNIVLVVKRTVEYIVLGQASPDPWW